MKQMFSRACVLVMLGAMAAAVWADEGVVLELVDSTQGYLYVQVDQDGQKLWLALNEMPVKVGDRLSYDEGMSMTNFRSEYLQRSFATMRFVNKVEVVPGVPSVPSVSVVPAK